MPADADIKGVPSLRLSFPAFLKPILIGLAIGMAFIVIVSVGSGLVLSKQHAAQRAQDALLSGAIPMGAEGLGQDYFTDCTFLATLIVRSDDAVTNAIAIWRPDAVYTRPCDGLGNVATKHVSWEPPKDQAPYVNYPFGSRYVEAFVLAVTDYGMSQKLWLIASYVSVLGLFMAARLNNRRTAYLTLPIYFALGFFFAQHQFGSSYSHAAGFVCGFGLLAFMLGANRLFASFSNRVVLFMVLALLMTYFDLLSGALLVTLSLALVLNHFFYVRPQSGNMRSDIYLKTICSQSAAIVACFLGCYLFLTGLHLALVSLVHGGALQAFRDGLAVRVSSTDNRNAHVTVQDLITKLWLQRDQLSPFGPVVAGYFLFAAGVAWLFSVTGVWIAARTAGRRVVYDLGVVAVAASGVIAWYLLFTNHSYIHAWFTVRFLAMPASLGFVAALLVLEHARLPNLLASRGPKRLEPAPLPVTDA